MKKLTFLISLLLCLGIGAANAQYTDLLDFNGTNGAEPIGGLTLSGNVLYGTTATGGVHGYGNIFSININGSECKDLYDFEYPGLGAAPCGTLMLSGTKLYGMTQEGAVNDKGNIFSIDTNGNNYKDLWDFNDTGTNGSSPTEGSLTLSGTKLYGMTNYGGRNNLGCIFSIDTTGSGYKDILDFNGTNGSYPSGSLTLSISGKILYGMTPWGGANDSGSIFSIDTNGFGYKDLLDFSGVNGRIPYGSLILSENKLYGMTMIGGANHDGNIFSIDTNGTRVTDLLDFNRTNGWQPPGSLTLSGNKFYGMTYYGGAKQYGNVFSVDTNGTIFTDLLDFNSTNGKYPAYSSLILSNNLLYGMTTFGGANNKGVIFSLDTNSVTSINEITMTTGGIAIYPNPNNGKFNVSIMNTEQGIMNVEVYNVLGENMLTETLRFVQGDNSINLSNQPNGVYLYRVIAQDGSLVGEGKLIIQK